MLTLSFNYLSQTGILRTEIVKLNPISGFYDGRVHVQALTSKDIKALKNFFAQFAQLILEQKILPDTTMTTVNNYLMSYLESLSIAKLLQFGLQVLSNGLPFKYSVTQADRLAITNVSLQFNGILINVVTIALNLFWFTHGEIKTKFIAFTKLNNGQKFVTFVRDDKLKFRPFQALTQTIKRSHKQVIEPGFMIDEANVYKYVTGMYKAYETLIQQSLDGDNASKVVLAAMLELTVYADPRTQVIMNPMNSEYMSTFWIKLRSECPGSLVVGFSFVVVDYLTSEIAILSFAC